MKKLLIVIMIVSLFVVPLTAYADKGGNKGDTVVTPRYVPCPIYATGHRVVLQDYDKIWISSGQHIVNGLICHFHKYKEIYTYGCDCGYGYQQNISYPIEHDCDYWL